MHTQRNTGGQAPRRVRAKSRILVTAVSAAILATALSFDALAIGPGLSADQATRPAVPVVPIVIEGVEFERGGELLVMLFGRDGFPIQHDRALSVRRLPADSNRLRIEVPIAAEGDEFAIKVLHDQDRNGRVTKNFIGLPAEGLGFSNGAVLNFGPPKFNAALFRREDAGKLQRIRLQYL